mmetsp:Transcript_88067/g.247567  ORF Transcript_88067/g.247567 Transcript_88067/m.247567 type:complete len:223 (-) Transcript_88067:1778-2446(-)
MAPSSPPTRPSTMPFAAASSKAFQIAEGREPVPAGGSTDFCGTSQFSGACGTAPALPTVPPPAVAAASRNGSVCHWPGTVWLAGGAGGCCDGGAGRDFSCNDISESCQTMSRYCALSPGPGGGTATVVLAATPRFPSAPDAVGDPSCGATALSALLPSATWSAVGASTAPETLSVSCGRHGAVRELCAAAEAPNSWLGSSIACISAGGCNEAAAALPPGYPL